MELVTQSDEARELDHRLQDASRFDLILDDGTYLPDSFVIEARAFGILVGGHTGIVLFAEIPSLAFRRVHQSLPLSRRYHFPFFGRWLRHRWASQAGARLTKPDWVPAL